MEMVVSIFGLSFEMPISIVIIGTLISSMLPAFALDYIIHSSIETVCVLALLVSSMILVCCIGTFT